MSLYENTTGSACTPKSVATDKRKSWDELSNAIIVECLRRSTTIQLKFVNNTPVRKTQIDRVLLRTLYDKEIQRFVSDTDPIKLLYFFARNGYCIGLYDYQYMIAIIANDLKSYARMINPYDYPELLVGGKFRNVSIVIRRLINFSMNIKRTKLLNFQTKINKKIGKLAFENKFSILNSVHQFKSPVLRQELSSVVYKNATGYHIRKLDKRRPSIINDISRLVETFDEPEVSPYAPQYIVFLKQKIRNLINQLMAKRTNSVVEDIEMQPIEPAQEAIEDNVASCIQECFNAIDDAIHEVPLSKVQPEMMSNEDNVTTILDKGPVQLANIGEVDSVVITEEIPTITWSHLSCSDKIVDLQMTSNFPIIKHFDWKSDQIMNTQLLKIALPSELLKDNPTHPAALLFKQYAYWNGDMVVRMHLNTNPFQIGSLKMWFYYAALFDKNMAQRENVFNGIIMDAVTYNASEGKDVELRIPFKNYRTALSTRKRSSNALPLYMGHLYVYVLNPLISEGDTTAGGYIHLMFENNKFYGILPAVNYVQPEMLPVGKALKIAESGLHLINKTVNMDKPTAVTPINPLVPVLQDSFASGSNDVVYSRPLRLDPLGQTQHPYGLSSSNETSIDFIKQRIGYVTTVMLSTDDVQGSIIWTADASPEFRNIDLPTVKIAVDKEFVIGTVLPPITALCSIHGYYRGEYELLFEIINSRYHTGALIIGYAPGLETLTAAQIPQTYNAIMNIGNQSKYIFKVPFISDKPFIPRYVINKEHSTPHVEIIGNISVAVLNPLRHASGTSDKIYINIYVRACPSFEFMTPISPSYTYFWNGKKPNNLVPIYPVVNNGFGIGNWRYSDVIQTNMNIVRYSSSADSIADFKNIVPFVVYEADKFINLGVVAQINIAGDVPAGNQYVNIGAPTYLAMFIVNGDKNKYTYAVPFTTKDIAIAYVDAHIAKVTRNDPYPDSPRYASNQTILWYNRCQNPSDGIYYRRKQIVTWNPVYQAINNNIQAEMDDPIHLNVGDNNLASTMNSMSLVGENFSDLKDYMRRYQYLTTITLSNIRKQDTYNARIPITPTGLEITSDMKNTYSREGIIGYIGSMYRFARGGIRYKFVLSSPDGQLGDISICFQHKPNILIKDRLVKYNGQRDNYQNYLLTGYAFDILSSRVNNSISIEIPAYMSSTYLMMQSPNFEEASEIIHYSLGVIDLYVLDAHPKTVDINVYMSIADDMHFSNFIGLPPVVRSDGTIIKQIMKIQDDEEDFVYVLAKNCDTIQPEMDDPISLPDSVTKQIESEGIFNRVKSYLVKTKNKYIETSCTEYLNDKFDIISNDEEESLFNTIKAIIKKYALEYEQVLINAFFQIVQCINNPTISVFAIAVSSLLISLGFKTGFLMNKLIKIISNIFSSNIQAEVDAGENETGESPEVAKMTFVSTIVSACASTLGYCIDKYKNIPIPDFTNKMFSNIRFGAMTVNAVITMFKNLFNVIPIIFNWIIKVCDPRKWYAYFFSDNKDIITKWIKDVEYVLNPHNKNKILSDISAVRHVEILDLLGRDILLKLKEGKYNVNHNFQYIQGLYRKFSEMYHELILSKAGCGSIGFEPYCPAFIGDSQIGKSYEIEAMCLELLKSINYKSYNHPVYVKPKGNYYTGALNQPIIILDDFLHNKTEQEVSKDVMEFLTLKSAIPFQPPQAEIERKHVKFAPLIAAITQNEAFPLFNKILANPYAWMKRRDLLVHVQKHGDSWGNVQNARELPNSVTYNKNHLRYRIYSSNMGGDYNAKTGQVIAHTANQIYKCVSVPDKFKQEIIEQAEDIKIVKEFGIPTEDAKMIRTSILEYHQLMWYMKQDFNKAYSKSVREYLDRVEKLREFIPEADKQFNQNFSAYRDYVNSIRSEHSSETMAQVDKYIRDSKGIDKSVKIDICSFCAKMPCLCDVENVQSFLNTHMQSVSEKGQVSVNEAGPSNTNIIIDDDSIEPQMPDTVEIHNKTPYEISGASFNIRNYLKYRGLISHNDKIQLQAFIQFKSKFETLVTNHALNMFLSSRVAINAQFFSPRQYDILLEAIDTDNPMCDHILFLCLHHEKILDNIVFEKESIIVEFGYEQNNVSYDCTCSSKFSESQYYQDYKNILIDIHTLNRARGVPSIRPKFIEVEFKNQNESYKKWLRRTHDERENVMKTLNTEKSTILGIEISKIKKVCIGLGVILTTIGAVYGMKHIYDNKEKLGHSISKMRLNLFKKEIDLHEPTQECETNKCRICFIAKGEMAYNEKVFKKNVITKVEPKMQAEMADEVFRSVLSKIRRNTFFIIGVSPDKTCTPVRCLGLWGHYFVAIDHYLSFFKNMSSDSKFYYKTAQVSHQINFSDITMTFLKDSALVLCKMPVQINAFQDIVSKIMPIEQISNMSPNIRFIEISLSEELSYNDELGFRSPSNIASYDVTLYDDYASNIKDSLSVPSTVENSQPTYVKNALQYRVSGKGKCGSVIINLSNTTTPIVGIHIAGFVAGGTGYAEMICQETFIALRTRFIKDFDHIVGKVECQMVKQGTSTVWYRANEIPNNVKCALPGNYHFIGVVSSELAHNPPVKSKCMHTLCYNQITQSTYDYPILSPKDDRALGLSPMVEGCSHHTNPPIDFQTHRLKRVVSYVKDLILAKVKPCRLDIGVLSREQAIVGIPDIINYDAMEFDTSEGFPLSSRRPKTAKNKKWLFTLEETVSGYRLDNIDEHLIAIMDSKHEERKQGLVPFTVFVDCLKDLKLPKEKVKPRVFSISPVDFTIQFRQYFYDFTIAYQTALFDVESAIGINVDSMQWTDMVHKLLGNSSIFCCGDYSKFGPRLMSKVCDAVFRIIVEWYQYYGKTTVEDDRIRYIMGIEIYHAKHLMFNMIYEVLTGAPSGSPITTILNNIVNCIYIRYVYDELFEQYSRNAQIPYDIFKCGFGFSEGVVLICYGDDLISTIKPHIFEFFNGPNIQQAFAKYNIKFTDALKTGDISDTLNLYSDGTSFLKRNIERHPFRPLVYVPKMSQRAIEETCNWCFKSPNMISATNVACQAMFLNAHGHGPKYYNELRQRVILWWRKYNRVIDIPLWEEVDDRIFQN